MKKLNSKAKEVLDICLAAESPEVKAKVYEILEIGELDASDPMFLVLALTGQMRVLLEAAPAELSQLLTNWKETSTKSLQQIEQAVTQVKSTQQQQADTIRQTIETVANNCVEDIKEVGMATTGAIAEANNEVLTKSLETVLEIHSLKNQISSLKEVVEKDRETYLIVLNGLVSQAAQTQIELSEQSKKTKTELDTSIQYIKSCYTALKKIQSGTTWIKWAEWFSPLTALGLAAIAGAIVWGWGLHMYWGEAEKYLPVIKQNQAAFDKCFNSEGLVKIGMDCQIVYKKVKKAKK